MSARVGWRCKYCKHGAAAKESTAENCSARLDELQSTPSRSEARGQCTQRVSSSLHTPEHPTVCQGHFYPRSDGSALLPPLQDPIQLSSPAKESKKLPRRKVLKWPVEM